MHYARYEHLMKHKTEYSFYYMLAQYLLDNRILVQKERLNDYHYMVAQLSESQKSFLDILLDNFYEYDEDDLQIGRFVDYMPAGVSKRDLPALVNEIDDMLQSARKYKRGLDSEDDESSRSKAARLYRKVTEIAEQSYAALQEADASPSPDSSQDPEEPTLDLSSLNDGVVDPPPESSLLPPRHLGRHLLAQLRF